MKKIIIGSLVGAVIMFVWSFLMWAVLPCHLHTFMYTPAQDSLLKGMAESNMETGVYGLPMADNRAMSGFNNTFHEESENLKEGWNMGGMTFVRGFLWNLFALMALCIMLSGTFGNTSSFFGRWWLVLLAGVLLVTQGPLMQHNWMGFPYDFTMRMAVDIFGNWAVAGLWLAWYFGRK
jgi:hypothetical protein